MHMQISIKSSARNCRGGLQEYFRTLFYQVWFLRTKFHLKAEMSPLKSVELHSCKIISALKPFTSEGQKEILDSRFPFLDLALSGEPAGTLAWISLVWRCSSLVLCPRILVALRRWSKLIAEWSLTTASPGHCRLFRALHAEQENLC